MASAIRSRPVVFGIALASLALMAAGVVLDGWMATLPANIDTSCVQVGSGSICSGSVPNPEVQFWQGLLMIAVGIGLLVVAWKLDRRFDVRPRQRWKILRAWGAPLLWLAFLPIIAGPASFVIAGFSVKEPTCHVYITIVGTGGAACPLWAFVPAALITGFLNLIPLCWLWSADPRTRIAAASATVLGTTGLIASLSVLFVLGPTVEWDYGFFLPNPPPPVGDVFWFGTVIWLMTLIALLVIAKLPLGVVRPAGIEPAAFRSGAERSIR